MLENHRNIIWVLNPK